MWIRTSSMAFIAVILACQGMEAKPRTREEPMIIAEASLEAKKQITETDWKPNGTGDWLLPFHVICFRTTNGKWAKIKVNKDRSFFNNCKLIWSSGYAPKNGEWSNSGIKLEAIKGDQPWSYSLIWDIEREGGK